MVDDVVPARLFSNREVHENIRDLAIRRAGKKVVGDAISTGIKFIDDNNPPLTRGDTSLIVGLTSEGKSMMASTIVNHTLKEISYGQRSVKSAVVVVLTEETNETRRVQMWGDHRVSIKKILSGAASMDVIEENIVRSDADPLYFIGDSCGAEVSSDENMGALTVRKIIASIEVLVRSGIAPELVVIDHAHDLATERRNGSESETYEQISRDLVQMASWLRQYCPMLALLQGKKEIQGRSGEQCLPTKYDMKFMGALAARARDIHSICYPLYHIDDGKVFKTSRGDTFVTKGTFISALVKGRYAECTGKSYPLSTIDSQGHWTGMLREMQMVQL